MFQPLSDELSLLQHVGILLHVLSVLISSLDQIPVHKHEALRLLHQPLASTIDGSMILRHILHTHTTRQIHKNDFNGKRFTAVWSWWIVTWTKASRSATVCSVSIRKTLLVSRVMLTSRVSLANLCCFACQTQAHARYLKEVFSMNETVVMEEKSTIIELMGHNEVRFKMAIPVCTIATTQHLLLTKIFMIFS